MNLDNKQKIVFSIKKMDGMKTNISHIVDKKLSVMENGHLYIESRDELRTLRKMSNSGEIVGISIKFDSGDVAENEYLITKKDFMKKNKFPVRVESIPVDVDRKVRKIVYEKLLKAFDEYVEGMSVIKIDLDYKEIIREALEDKKLLAS